ncbi:unnamed protein product [Ectocarpus sp. CCAP 1310/34]|nr:unnamed protein product [Ectocarpus sp. CCAP 1310/34]
MDNSVETTTTLRGRHTKVPAKYQHNRSLGAAVGGGGLLSSTPNPLPGFKGTARSNTGGASDTNTQSEGVAGGPGHVAPTASAQQRTGNSDSESEDDDRGRQHGRGAGGADGGSSSGAGGGSSGGAGGGRLSRAGSSAAVESVARTMRQLQSSLNRNRNKSYNKWSAYLLREACALRRLSGYSRSKDTDKMAAGLTQLDIVMSRSSPYLADLEDKATGGTPPSKPPASSAEAQRVPQNLITAVRAAIRSGLSPEPNKMYDCDGKSYTVAAIMAAIKEEDRADGRGEGIGQRRKSKHCVPRFCELLMHPQFRERFGASRLQLSKKELDAKQKGTTRDIHLEIWEAFKDEKFKVSNGEMFSFCKERLDTYYFWLTAEKCPDILAVCDQMLPDGTARESTGVETAGDGHSGAQGASADASKRKVAKVESRERNVGVSGHQEKKKKQDAQIENTAKVAMSAVKGELGLDALFGTSSAPTYADAPTSFYDTKEGLENKTAKLEYIAKLRKELQEIKEDIRKEKELGSDADEEDLQLLRDWATTVRAQIRKETAAASEDG